MEIGVNGVLGQLVQPLVEKALNHANDFAMTQNLQAMDYTVLKMEVLAQKLDLVQD